MPRPIIRHPHRKQRRRRPLVLAALAGIIGIYLIVVVCYNFLVLEPRQQHDAGQSAILISKPEAPDGTKSAAATTVWERRAKLADPIMRFDDFLQLAMELARLTPTETLRRLDEDDPFGVRSLNTSQSLANLPCPVHQRISLPDYRNHSRSRQFRNNEHGTFLYFQHLRKAGGTHFCTLATDNLPKQNLPPYYCMPDYQWPTLRLPSSRTSGTTTTTAPRPPPRQQCAGCLHQYTNEEITTFLNAKHHRIAGNEWDSFDVDHHFDLEGATYVTSFRDPANRAVSQFRFECLEHRGCKASTFDEYWKRRRDLYNVYTWTFSDVQRQGSIMQSAEFADQRAAAMKIAMDTLARFHLVLNMEWLEDAEHAIQTVLGFTNTQTLHRTVRPHNQGLQRSDSYDARTFLHNNATFDTLRRSLALDEVLTDVARRLFLERLVCPDLDS